MRVDEVHLKDEGLFLAVDDYEVEMVDVGDHGENLPALWAEEILGYPILEVLCLTDVDDLIASVFHKINARFGRKKRDLGFELFAKFHPLYLRWTMVAPPPPSSPLAPS